MKGITAYTGLIRLGGLLILLPLAVWSWGIRPTVELRRSVREQAARIEAVQRTPVAVSPAPVREETGEAIRSGAVLHRLAPVLERFGVTAERYTPLRLHAEAGAELYAGELLLGGDFHALTRLLEEIERGCTSERIVSVGYTAAVRPQSRKKELQMTVVFQQITQNTMP